MKAASYLSTWPSLLVFAVGSIFITIVFSYITFVSQGLTFPDQFLSIWNRWDSGYYQLIAEHGYTKEEWGRRLIAFFPFYPLLIKAISIFIKNYLVAALITANLAYIVTISYFYSLVQMDYGHDIAWKSIIALTFFPTAYFFHAPYSESLFLALVIASFYYARKGQWAFCSIAAMLAGATRITGLALIFAIPLEYWLQTREWRRRALWLLLIPLGLIAYLLINYAVYGHPLAFLEIQQTYWHNVEGAPWLKGLGDAFHRALHASPWERILLGWFQLIFAILGLLVVILSIKLRITYAVYGAVIWIISTFPTYWVSLPRYILPLFPLFMLLALSKRDMVIYLYYFLFLLFHGWLILRFVQGQWAF